MRALTGVRILVAGVMLALSAAAAAENAVTTEPASVRAGPDSSYPVVAQLEADSPIQVMGCLDDWSWCDVVFEDYRGWLYSPDITYAYEGGYVPLYSYAPALGVPVVSFSIGEYWGSYYHDRPWYRQRDEWEHRPIHHQRPPGPPPSRSLPPREVVRADRGHVGSDHDQRLRLGRADGRAEPSDRNVERRGGTANQADPRAPAARPQQNSPPPIRPAERIERPQERVGPQHPEEHSRPAERADTPRHEERRAAPERSEGPPRREEEGDHPR